MLKTIARRLNHKSRLFHWLYRQTEAAFRPFDDRHLYMTTHLARIPQAHWRRGGNHSLQEYAYSIGLMAAHIAQTMPTTDPQVLDLGCGTGRMYSALYPFLGERGRYIGLDIRADEIAFDRAYYPPEKTQFILAEVTNAFYRSAGGSAAQYNIPLADAVIDYVTAFSLFTHLNRSDSENYFRELARVVKPGGRMLLTFFVLDEHVDQAKVAGTRWHFDTPLADQPEWYWTAMLRVPEAQIGVTRAGIDDLCSYGFTLQALHKGWWCGRAAPFWQDILVFERTSRGDKV